MVRVRGQDGGESRDKPQVVPIGMSRVLKSQVYEILREMVGNMDIYSTPEPPRLDERKLADELGVSRTPVREALIRLEKEGLVEIIPRRGMRVVPISTEDMREIYEVITCLEAKAAERLASRKPSAEELAPMIEAQEAMEDALDRGDLDAWAAADERFHRHLLELSGNRRLAQMAFAVFGQIHRARMVTLRMRPLSRQSNKDHRALIEAALAGDAETAYRVHYEHRRQAMEQLTDILKRHNLSQL